MTEKQGIVAISGASGMLGTALRKALEPKGWQVRPMVRSRDRDGIYWSVEEEAIDTEALAGVDAVIHLAGENLNASRWTEAQKERILSSRTIGTDLIARAVASLEEPPEVMIVASAVGYYGHRGDEWVDEASEPGEGFLSEVCQQWEAAADPARDVCAVIHARLGVILAAEGGALDRMLTPFKFGLGGRIGTGRQYMSWVSIDDAVKAFLFLLENPSLKGPVNICSPEPVTNQEFTKTFGKVIGRPTLLPVPTPALKLVVGSELAEEMLLHGQRVRPTRLVEAGFNFEHPQLVDAMEAALKDR